MSQTKIETSLPSDLTTHQATGYLGTIASVLLGVILLAASCLKAYSLAVQLPSSGESLVNSFWLQTVLIECEAACAIWLLLNVGQVYALTTALFAFALFSCVSLFQAVTGMTSCGCFGPVPTPPWIIFMFDITLVVLLSLYLGKRRKQSAPPAASLNAVRLRLACGAILMALIGTGLATTAAGAYSSDLGILGKVVSSDNVIRLTTDKWQGQSFPLIDYVDRGSLLRSGQWEVMLYRQGCPHCEEALTNLITSSHSDLQNAKEPMQFMVIRIPPVNHSQLLAGPQIVLSTLSDEYEWLVKTPLSFSLDSGIVVQVNDDSGISQKENHLSRESFSDDGSH